MTTFIAILTLIIFLFSFAWGAFAAEKNKSVIVLKTINYFVLEKVLPFFLCVIIPILVFYELLSKYNVAIAITISIISSFSYSKIVSNGFPNICKYGFIGNIKFFLFCRVYQAFAYILPLIACIKFARWMMILRINENVIYAYCLIFWILSEFALLYFDRKSNLKREIFEILSDPILYEPHYPSELYDDYHAAIQNAVEALQDNYVLDDLKHIKNELEYCYSNLKELDF